MSIRATDELAAVRGIAALAALAAAVAVQGCRKDTVWPPEPAPVHFGEDACAACSMIISDPNYAAQIRSPDGAVQVFDDIGCMLNKARATTDPVGVFVRAADDARWIRGDRAYVLKGRAIASPMGYGFLGFADRSDAEAAARAHPDGVVVALKSLLGGPTPLPGADRPELSVKGEVSE